MADAQAWWSGGAEGPSRPLAERARTRAAQDKELQDILSGIAGQKSAIQNRNLFFGLSPTSETGAATTSAPTTSAPTTSAPTTSISQVNMPQAKVGAAELNQASNGLLGLVKDPGVRMALGAIYLDNPTKAVTQLFEHVAKEASTPDEIKTLRFALATLPPELHGAATIAKLIPKGIDVQEVFTPTGETKKSTGFDIAGQYVRPGVGGAQTTTPRVAQTAPAATTTAPAATTTAPAATTTAPAATSRTGLTERQTEALGGVLSPGTKESAEVLKETAMVPIKARQKGLEKAYVSAAEEGDQISQNYLDAPSNKNDAMTLKELAKRTAPNLGMFQKPGPASAFMNTLDSGALKLGPLGTIGIPLDKAAARLVPGTDETALQNRERIESLLASQELAVARMNKGQGSWTELERDIIRGITGTVKNSAQFLIRRAELLEAKADFDEKLGQAAKDWLRANRGKTYYDFKQDSDEYEKIIRDYRTTLRNKFANEFLAGQNAPAGISKDTQGIMNLYPAPKKEGSK
jgi:hypothetical protein